MKKQSDDYLADIENNLDQQNMDTSDKVIEKHDGMETREKDINSDVMKVDDDDLIELKPIQNELDLGMI